MWKNNNCEWKMIKTKTKSASLRFKSWMQWSAEKHFILSVFILSISISFWMCFFYFSFVIFFFIVVYFINLSKTLENEESHKKRTATTFEKGKKSGNKPDRLSVQMIIIAWLHLPRLRCIFTLSSFTKSDLLI